MILITGATGLVGSDLMHLIDQDPNIQNENVICLVRKTSQFSSLVEKGFQIRFGDVTDKNSLLEAVKDVEMVIHIVQIRYAPTLVDVINQVGIRRVVIIGTTGVFSRYQMYREEYEQAEEYIREYCTASYIVLRPTMIYGGDRDKNMHRMIRIINRYHCFPVFGDGSGLMQPIYYKDVSWSIYTIMNRSDIQNKFYNIAGKKPMQYREIIEISGKAIGRKIIVIKIPYSLSIFLMYLYNKVSRRPKIKLEQVRRLKEDKAFDYSEASKDFGFNPTDFQTGIRMQIQNMI